MNAVVGRLALILGALTAAACQRTAEPGGRPPVSPYVVDSVVVRPAPFRDTLAATGTLRAHEAVELPAQRAGVVKEVRFEEGRAVKAGDVLVVIDDSELQAQLQRAEAQLALAVALEKRQRELLERGQFAPLAEYDERRAHLAIAQAEAALIRAQLDKTRIVAPFDGIAGLRRISVGAYLSEGTPVATLQDVQALKLDFTLPERYLPYLRVGQPVSFRVAGFSDSLAATVDAIEPLIDVSTRSLHVRALARNDDGRLLPGAFAEVRLPVQEIPDAIVIPPIALIPGLKEYQVYLHVEGTVEARVVDIGLRNSDAVQIVSGLRPGDDVIVSGVLNLRPGMPVQVRAAGTATAGRQESDRHP